MSSLSKDSPLIPHSSSSLPSDFASAENSLAARVALHRSSSLLRMSYKVLVTEADSLLGIATIRQLLRHYPQVLVLTGVEDVNSLELSEFSDILNEDPSWPLRIRFLSIPTRDGIMDEERKAELSECFSSADAVLLIPSEKEPQRVGEMYIEAATAALPSFVAMISLTDAAQSVDQCAKLHLASIFKSLENKLADSGVDHCILRVPSLLDKIVDNFAAHIKCKSEFSTSADSNAPFNYISATDVGVAASRVVVERPESCRGRTLTLTGSNTVSFSDISHILSVNLGRKISYQRISESQAEEMLVRKGYSSTQSKGMIERWQMQNEKRPHVLQISSDFRDIIGVDAQSAESFFHDTAPLFR